MKQIAFAILLSSVLAACSSSGSVSSDDDDPTTVIPSPTAAGEVIFTEIMADPATLADALGEWFEVQNAATRAFNLLDCVLGDFAGGNFLVDVDLVIGVGEYRTFSSGASPGFAPDFNYNGSLILENFGDTVTLTCNGIEIDSRSYLNPTTGNSSALSNDGNGNWCDDTGNFYFFSNSGTPGEANIDC